VAKNGSRISASVYLLPQVDSADACRHIERLRPSTANSSSLELAGDVGCEERDGYGYTQDGAVKHGHGCETISS
jgi:hypothetical protein